jgi:hypothetical protein
LYLTRHCDHVIGAGDVTAQTTAPMSFFSFSVKAQPAAKHIHAADFFTDQWIIRFSEILRGALISVIRGHRVTLLQSEEAAPGLDCRVKMRGLKEKSDCDAGRIYWRKSCRG